MPNPNLDRRRGNAMRTRAAYAQPDDIETIVLEPRPVKPQRHAVPARASGLRPASVSAPTTTRQYPLVRQQPAVQAPEDFEAEDEADRVTRMPSSARVSQYTSRQPVVAGNNYETHYPLKKKGKRGVLGRLTHVHPLLLLGTGMLAAATLFVAGTYAVNTVKAWEQRWNYGPVPTYAVDFAVGHNGDSLAHPSHFLATDSEGRVMVFEMSPDGTKILYYTINTLSGGQPSVTLKFEDVNHDGKVDMEILVAGNDAPIVCLNDGTKFDAPLAE